MARILSWVRVSDFIWFLIFGAMHFTSAADSAKTEVIT